MEYPQEFLDETHFKSSGFDATIFQGFEDKFIDAKGRGPADAPKETPAEDLLFPLPPQEVAAGRFEQWAREAKQPSSNPYTRVEYDRKSYWVVVASFGYGDPSEKIAVYAPTKDGSFRRCLLAGPIKSGGLAIAFMHHRAQLLYLLRRLGLPNLIEGDVISWESRPLASVRPGCYTRAVPRAVAPAPPSGAQDAEMRSSAAGARGEAPMASVVLLAFGALACGLLAVGLIGVAIRYRKEEWLKSYKLGLTIAVLLLAGSAEWCFTQALKKAEAVDRGQVPAPAPEPAKP